MDQAIGNLYRKEALFSKQIALFSLLSILISVVGVFGLVLFDMQYRRKEIGLRKVHGATSGEILRMFNAGYIRIILICFAVATPITWYAGDKWLERFAYRTPIDPWIFGTALSLVLSITVATISLLCYRTAREKPGRLDPERIIITKRYKVMKILLRNLVNLFARNKTAALLNIAGLTVAFASFMLIMMQVWYELGYDRCYPNANRIYGLCFQVPQSGDLGTVLPRPLAEKLLRSSAGIETGGCLSYQHGDPNVPFFRPERGPESAIAAGFSLVSRSWLDVFGFETLSGDLNAFSEPNAAIIPHSLAVKLFGSEKPVGQTIAKSEGYREAAQFTIVAVYRDFPKNASLKNDVYTDLKERLLQDFNNCSTPYFVRVKQNADIRRIEQDLLPLVWNYAKTYDEDSTRSQRLRLVGLNDLYFFNETISQEGGNRNTTYSLLTVCPADPADRGYQLH